MDKYSYDPIMGQAHLSLQGQEYLDAKLRELELKKQMDATDFKNHQFLSITQEIDWGECIMPCLCEKQNTYEVVSLDVDGIKQMDLGMIYEDSICSDRLFCQCWRALELNFVDKFERKRFSAKRPYRIPTSFCMPCNRPEISVKDERGEYVGLIRETYMYCGRSKCKCLQVQEMDILDKDGNKRYYISATCCQSGEISRCMRLPRCCGSCQRIYFDILNITGDKVGSISNIYVSCFTEVFTKADRYMISFPKEATQSDRYLLTVAAIIIDYDKFESTCFA